MMKDMMSSFDLASSLPTSTPPSSCCASTGMPGAWQAATTASTGSRTAASSPQWWSTWKGSTNCGAWREVDDGIEIGAMTTLTAVRDRPAGA